MKIKLNDELDTVINLRELLVCKVSKMHNKDGNVYELHIQYRMNGLDYHDSTTLLYKGKKHWDEAYTLLVDNI